MRLKYSGISVGILTIFSIFCFIFIIVFSLLTYISVIQEERLSESVVTRTALYYNAEKQAVDIVKQIKQDNEAQTDIEIINEGNYYEFVIPVSDKIELLVGLMKETDGVKIVAWNTQYSGEWNADRSIKLANFD